MSTDVKTQQSERVLTQGGTRRSIAYGYIWKAILPIALPDLPKGTLRAGSSHSLLYFESNWTPHFVTLRSWSSMWATVLPASSRPITYLLKKGFTPVLEQLNLKWKRVAIAPSLWGLLFVVGIVTSIWWWIGRQ